MSPIDALLRAARRLRGRDLTELRVRGAQAVAAWRERRGLSADARLDEQTLSRWLSPSAPRDPAALLAAFRSNASPRPRFFAAFNDRAGTTAVLRRSAPGDAASALARAEKVLAGRFDLLGYRDLSFGSPIDWHLDPRAGKRAPRGDHWSRVPYLDASVVGDHKLVWELNRQQYLVPLGQAYWYTGDERFAEAFARHVGDWMDANPPKRGINWASSLEVAFRAMSWTWAAYLFRESPSLTPPLYARMLAMLHVHARHLETYLSTYFSPNTHLTGEALGLVFIGVFFPDLAGAERWRRLGTSILVGQLARQVRPDGVYFEQASQYQRYTTEFYLQLMLLAERNDGLLDDSDLATVKTAVLALVEHLRHLTRPDGTIPLIGDDDGGRLVQLDHGTPDDVRALLATAAAAFGRADFVPEGGVDVAPAVWLLGPDASASLHRLVPTAPPPHGRAFADGGYFVLRDGWGPRALHAVVDCGPHGVFNCGHAHADVLSLTLAGGGVAILVDGGTYTYPDADRNAFRGADAHNVLTVDGQGASLPAAGAFQWERIAHGRPLAWAATRDFDYFAGTHDGFAHLEDPVAHTREVLRMGSTGIVVRDVVRAAGPHRLAIRWHLAPGLEPRTSSLPGGNAVDVFDADGEPVARLAILGSPGRLRIEDGWSSKQYGVRDRIAVCVYEVDGTGPQEIVTLFLPATRRAERHELPAVRAIAAAGGVGVAIAPSVQHSGAAAETLDDGGTTELLVVGAPAVSSEAGLESDGSWVWVRRAPDGEIRSCLVIGGEWVKVNGWDILQSDRTGGAGWRYAAPGAGEAIEAGELEMRAPTIVPAAGQVSGARTS